MAILKIENLFKIIMQENINVTALDHVSLEINKGEFVAIIAASESSKSTLMHLIGGFDPPTSGNVKIDGQDIYKLNESELAIFRRRNIGIIYQSNNLIPTLTAEENIMLPCLLDNYRPDKDKLCSILKTIGLFENAKYLPNEMPESQQQKVSVGRALINNPAIIFAYEPTRNLDSKSWAEIIDLFKLINMRYKQTLVIITHDEKIAIQADRIIVINNGGIMRDEVIRPHK